MSKKFFLIAIAFIALYAAGCDRAAIEKTTKPIRKTSDAVFKERSIGSEETAQAVIFPKEEEETPEKKQFQLKF